VTPDQSGGRPGKARQVAVAPHARWAQRPVRVGFFACARLATLRSWRTARFLCGPWPVSDLLHWHNRRRCMPGIWLSAPAQPRAGLAHQREQDGGPRQGMFRRAAVRGSSSWRGPQALLDHLVGKRHIWPLRPTARAGRVTSCKGACCWAGRIAGVPASYHEPEIQNAPLISFKFPLLRAKRPEKLSAYRATPRMRDASPCACN
jgi:hypothetical protein